MCRRRGCLHGKAAVFAETAAGKHYLTRRWRCVIIQVESPDSRQEGNRWRLAFTPPIQREVIIMTDYEILAIVLMIITLAFTIHIGSHKK